MRRGIPQVIIILPRVASASQPPRGRAGNVHGATCFVVS